MRPKGSGWSPAWFRKGYTTAERGEGVSKRADKVMDQKFLKNVQAAGWRIVGVDETSVIGACPSVGCGLKAKLDQGKKVPEVDPGCKRNVMDRPVASFSEIRDVLRPRREELGFVIKDVEEIAGLAVDYLAKFEKDDPSKIPNIEAVMNWAEALGYEFILRPKEMTPYALRRLAETRDKLDKRRRRFQIEARKRKQRTGR